LNRVRRGTGFQAGRWLSVMALGIGVSLPSARSELVLYEGAGTWAAVTGLPETDPPPLPDWERDSGVWVGRIPAGILELKVGDAVLETASAQPLPSAPILLPLQRNPFGKCLIRSLSTRYDSLVKSRKWSLMFDKEGEEPDFTPISMPVGPKVRLVLEMEDVPTGKRWNLLPTRRGREGGIFSLAGDARLYAGTVDQGDLEWNLLVVPGEEGQTVLQGRVLVMDSDSRRVRFRVMLQSEVPGDPLLQEESPPAVVALKDGIATGLFPDLAEPRRFRAVRDVPERMGLEFDLAVTKDTGNFPRTATFSLELVSWESAGPEEAASEGVARLARTGGTVPVPESILLDGIEASAVLEPGRTWVSPPGGHRGREDTLAYLLLKTSGLFPDHDWSASAFMCAARNAEGESRLEPLDDQVVVPVNTDPDRKALLELGQNRGQTVLARIRRSESPALWIRTSPDSIGLDYNPQALFLCDYPAVWGGDSPLPGLDLRHVEVELLASLACVLKEQDRCLLVSDDGPMAPFTTLHADALVCESADPAEMTRQAALAGPRPVLWTVTEPSPAAEALAQDLGFVRFRQMEED
jgi:hypothetical protein